MNTSEFRRNFAANTLRAGLLALVVSAPIAACGGKDSDPSMCVGQMTTSDLDTNLTQARNRLTYRPRRGDSPRVNPNGQEARRRIELITQKIGDQGLVDNRLTAIHDSIPNERKITEIDGNTVRSDAFSYEIEELKRIREELKSFQTPCAPSNN